MTGRFSPLGLGGLTLVEDSYLPELTPPQQIRFPKRTNKRERARWRRNPKNWAKGGEPYLVQMGHMVFAHPNTVTKLRRIFSEMNAQADQLDREVAKFWPNNRKGAA